MAVSLVLWFCRAVAASALAIAIQSEPAAARPWSVSTMAALQTDCTAPAEAATGMAHGLPSAPHALTSTARIGGVELTGSEDDLAALRVLLGDEIRLDRRRLPTGCASPDCAADAVFGRGVGVRLLYLLRRFGYNASPTAARDAQPWTAAQLDEIMSVFAALPPSLFQAGLANVRPLVLVRTPPASQPVIELGRGDHGIRLASLWSLLDPQARRGVLLHEFAHNVRTGLALAQNGPQSGRTAYWTAAARSPGQVSEYARWSDGEDFAESFVAYLRMPQHLKAVSPERYEYMHQHVFGGAAPACPAAAPPRRTQVAWHAGARATAPASR